MPNPKTVPWSAKQTEVSTISHYTHVLKELGKVQDPEVFPSLIFLCPFTAPK